jgi:hypothetical protein
MLFFLHAARTSDPWRTARFVQCGDEFFLEDEINPYRFAKVRVPKRSVVAGA